MQPACKPTLYEQLESLPEGLTGEILNGQLYAQPRPSGPHGRASVVLDRVIGRYYDDGEGPGGWWLFVEPEVHFIRDTEVAVPDLAGWRRARMPRIPEDHRFEVTPDWVCEILSPSTASKDREIKMPMYAHRRVPYAWLVDPKHRTLEAYALSDGQWRLLADASGQDIITVAPFEALQLDLGSLWTGR
jgi:Uma2 family endonuclease